jgi:transglutaminase-like putative cysteine protease
MDYESLKTPADDVVRDGASFEAYRLPGDLIDSQHPIIVAYARRVAGDGSDREKALRLYYAVRDELRYDPYNTPMKRGAYRASTTVATGHGYCVNKAGVMAAVCRAAGIPARLGYADVRNHMTTKRLSELMGSDVFYYHGYTDVWLDGHWVKATPAFNRELTDKFGLKPLDWDADGRFDLSPVRSQRPPSHGISRLSRRLRRHPVRGDPWRLPPLLPAHDEGAGGDGTGG